MPGHIGIIGVSAEGAALCYRTIAAEGRAGWGHHGHPRITMDTIPLREYMNHIRADRWDRVAQLMLASTDVLERAGADILICPDNTAHRALELIAPLSEKLLHIAEEVAAEALRRGFRRVGVLGTAYLMESSVYPRALEERGIEAVIPEVADRRALNELIFEELVYGRVTPATRQFVDDLIGRLRCDAVALACTEIPLVFEETPARAPVLDSTRILARAALREAAATDPAVGRAKDDESVQS